MEARSVGRMGALALVIGSMVGVGILITPPLVARAVDSVWMYMALWGAGGLVSVCGAVCYAELGVLMPRGGGDAIFQRTALGPSLAAASGAVVFLVCFAASIAAMAMALCTYQLPVLLEHLGLGAVLTKPVVAGGPTGTTVGALCVVMLLTGINAVGARAAARLQLVLCVVPLVGLAGLSVAALSGAPASVLDLPMQETPRVDLLTAFVAVYFSYAGWSTLVFVAGEVRQPERNLGVASAGGVAIITLLYLLVAAGLVRVFGLSGLAQLGDAGTALAQALVGSQGEVAMAGAVSLAILACTNGAICAGARIAVALAEERSAPSVFAARWGRGAAPVPALLCLASVVSVYILTGSFSSVLAASGIAMMLVGSLTIIALLRLRRIWPDRPRPFRVPRLRVVAGVYLLASCCVVVAEIVTAMRSGSLAASSAGVALLIVVWTCFAAASGRAAH